jgi:hypothetical protein
MPMVMVLAMFVNKKERKKI